MNLIRKQSPAGLKCLALRLRAKSVALRLAMCEPQREAHLFGTAVLYRRLSYSDTSMSGMESNQFFWASVPKLEESTRLTMFVAADRIPSKGRDRLSRGAVPAAFKALPLRPQWMTAGRIRLMEQVQIGSVVQRFSPTRAAGHHLVPLRVSCGAAAKSCPSSSRSMSVAQLHVRNPPPKPGPTEKPC